MENSETEGKRHRARVRVTGRERGGEWERGRDRERGERGRNIEEEREERGKKTKDREI